MRNLRNLGTRPTIAKRAYVVPPNVGSGMAPDRVVTQLVLNCWMAMLAEGCLDRRSQLRNGPLSTRPSRMSQTKAYRRSARSRRQNKPPGRRRCRGWGLAIWIDGRRKVAEVPVDDRGCRADDWRAARAEESEMRVGQARAVAWAD